MAANSNDIACADAGASTSSLVYQSGFSSCALGGVHGTSQEPPLVPCQPVLSHTLSL